MAAPAAIEDFGGWPEPSPTCHTTKTRFSQLNYGQHTGGTRSYSRAWNGLVTDFTRTLYGHRPFAGRLSSGRVCVRRLFVLRSFVVRSRPVWRSSCVGSCGVRARRRCGGRTRQSASLPLRRQRGRTAHRLHTDWRRTLHSSWLFYCADDAEASSEQ